MADTTADGASSDAIDPPPPQQQSWHPQTVVAAVIIVTAVIGATLWAAGDDAFELMDSAPENCAAETQTGSVEVAAPPSVQQKLSAEPVLQWTRVDPPIEEFDRTRTSGETVVEDDGTVSSSISLDVVMEGYGLVPGFATMPDGSVLVRANDNGRQRLWVTSNGVDWDELPIPSHVYPTLVRSADGRWVIAGPRIDDDFDREDRWDLDLVITSTDDGATWTDVPIHPPAPSLFWDRNLFTSDLMVSRHRIVLITRIPLEIRPTDPRIQQRMVEIEPESAYPSYRHGTVIVGAIISDSEDDITFSEIPLEGLDLTEREQRLLGDKHGIHFDDAHYTRIYAGNENGLEVAAEFPNAWAEGLATTDGFMLALHRDDPDGWQYSASTDGHEWGEMYSLSPRHGPAFSGIDADGEAWAVISDPPVHNALATLRCGEAPAPVADLDEFVLEYPSNSESQVGPAGFVFLAEPLDEFRSRFDPELGEHLENELGRSFEGTVSLTRSTTSLWVGWSRDGVDWSWQDTEDVFGVDVLASSIALAPGSDFFIASVQPRDEDPMWFVGKIS
ncbi:hypothetical protein [Candidatus Poriferisodalis sp.]|uniref:hypothetical protein n=1 Tax=Candidatus Poriferisodalis sp. TaxID=3101277 RepID=UPI003B59B340